MSYKIWMGFQPLHLRVGQKESRLERHKLELEHWPLLQRLPVLPRHLLLLRQLRPMRLLTPQPSKKPLFPRPSERAIRRFMYRQIKDWWKNNVWQSPVYSALCRSHSRNLVSNSDKPSCMLLMSESLQIDSDVSVAHYTVNNAWWSPALAGLAYMHNVAVFSCLKFITSLTSHQTQKAFYLNTELRPFPALQQSEKD